MNTENTTPTAELLETLRQLLNLTDRIDRLNIGERLDLTERSASRLAQCVDLLENRILAAEQDIATLTDRIERLRNYNSNLRDDLNFAVEQRDAARDEADELHDAVEELRALHEASSNQIHDCHPHLLDDLLDYTAHLRHTGADRKTIALLELTTSTLRTISTLLN